MLFLPFACLALLTAVSCGSSTDSSGQLEGDAHGSETEEVAKGPHGGRLLTDGAFALEITIFERGVPPEFRVYAFEDGQPIDPGNVDLEILLHRFGGRVDEITFRKRDDYLLGERTIDEPHSFRVDATATYGGAKHQWAYDSWEGRTELSPEAITASEISIEEVRPGVIRTSITANGRIVPNEEHLAHIIPRYPGVIRDVRKRLGDPVTKGEVVATVESNQSLQGYEVRSPITGTVIAKDVISGEFAGEGDVIYAVADLRTVWADLNVPHQDFQRVAVGQRVSIDAGQGLARAEGTIVYVSPFGAEDTQTLLARVLIPNPDGAWRPGLFVTATIVVDEAEVPLSVAATALQTYRDWDVVFLNDGSVFQAMPVELGRHDQNRVEITAGLTAGQRYAAENSFIVKADVGKSGASHDH
jgi:cobalt-zinc-cadmium efflux system membrane fusion protein